MDSEIVIQYQNILQQIQQEFSNWECIALFNRDGEVVASTEATYELDTIGAVNCSNLKIIEENLPKLYQKTIRQIVIRSSVGVLVLRPLPMDMILVMFSKYFNNLHQMLPVVSKLVSQITSVNLGLKQQ